VAGGCRGRACLSPRQATPSAPRPRPRARARTWGWRPRAARRAPRRRRRPRPPRAATCAQRRAAAPRGERQCVGHAQECVGHAQECVGHAQECVGRRSSGAGPVSGDEGGVGWAAGEARVAAQNVVEAGDRRPARAPLSAEKLLHLSFRREISSSCCLFAFCACPTHSCRLQESHRREIARFLLPVCVLVSNAGGAGPGVGLIEGGEGFADGAGAEVVHAVDGHVVGECIRARAEVGLRGDAHSRTKSGTGQQSQESNVSPARVTPSPGDACLQQSHQDRVMHAEAGGDAPAGARVAPAPPSRPAPRRARRTRPPETTT